jgi:hypothetical protein
MNEDRELRAHALDLALERKRADLRVDIIETARSFETYLRGETHATEFTDMWKAERNIVRNRGFHRVDIIADPRVGESHTSTQEYRDKLAARVAYLLNEHGGPI